VGRGALERRKLTLSKWLGFAKELNLQEKALHESLEPSVSEVLEGKRLLLLERLAMDVQWRLKIHSTYFAMVLTSLGTLIFQVFSMLILDLLS